MIETTPLANVDASDIYTDLAGLQQLKAQGHTDKSAALKNIAHQFESMMVQMMMKSMRDANAVFADGDITSSSDEKFYQDMFDSQLSLSLSRGKGFGIADAIVRQLQGRFGDGAAAPNATTDHSVADIKRQSILSSLLSDNQGDAAAAAVDNPVREAIYQLFSGDGEVTAEDSAQLSAAAANLDGVPATFVKTLRPLAQRIAKKLGVDSRVLLSQSALETGWGQKVLQCANGKSSFNFFNIKADDSWRGAVVTVPTIEYENGVAVRDWARFRVYDSPEQSFADYARLIAENPRYQTALQCAGDSRAYIHALAKSGYASDPQYAQKVLALLDRDELTPSATGNR